MALKLRAGNCLFVHLPWLLFWHQFFNTFPGLRSDPSSAQRRGVPHSRTVTNTHRGGGAHSSVLVSLCIGSLAQEPQGPSAYSKVAPRRREICKGERDSTPKKVCPDMEEHAVPALLQEPNVPIGWAGAFHMNNSVLFGVLSE